MSIPEPTSLLNSALDYARRGFVVFPLRTRGKKPITNDGFYNATQDDGIIRAWWGRNPNANIGIRCNGLLVADFDGYEGAESLTRLEQEHGKLPTTWTIRTGGGTEAEPKEQGLHFVYSCSPELNIRPGAGKYGYQNFDIRANDSYIVAAPSVTRLPYETVDDSPVANAPDWLIAVAKAGDTSKTANNKAPDKKIPNHQRNDYLFRLCSGLRAKGMSYETILAAIRAAYENDCDHEPPMDDKELTTIAKQAAKYEPGKPQDSKRKHEDNEPTSLKVVCLANVEVAEVSWLWYPRIPFGKFSLLEGDPGVGKSYVTLAIATAKSNGVALPGDTREDMCSVLIASAEDGLSDTIKPRLAAMGANTDVIHAVEGLFTLNDNGFEMLEAAIIETLPGLIIIDPLVAYLSGEMDINKANQVRYATSRLAALAEKYNAAVLAVRHLTKGGSQKAIYRGLGSVDFTAAARSVLMAGADPDDPNIRGIVHIKSNLAPTADSIGYELRRGDSIPFVWTATCNLTEEKLMAVPDKAGKSALNEAKEFLREFLDGREVEYSEITAEAKERDIKTATLNRAKKELCVITQRRGIPGMKAAPKSYWSLKK